MARGKAAKGQWSLGRETEGLSQWVPSNEDFLWKRSSRDIEQAIANPNDKSRYVISLRLESKAAWLGGRGLLSVLKNDPSGWSCIQGAFRLWLWRARAAVYFDRQDAGVRTDKTRIALCLCHAITTGTLDATTWCGDALVAQLNPSIPKQVWSLNWFAPFAVRLYAKWKGIQPEGLSSLPTIGIYERIFDAWQDETALAQALMFACDYHCSRSPQAPEEDFQEFVYHPWTSFPVDILAIRQVRADLGLATPEISHPLLDSPLVHFPHPMPEYHDELIDQAIAWLQEHLPGI